MHNYPHDALNSEINVDGNIVCYLLLKGKRKAKVTTCEKRGPNGNSLVTSEDIRATIKKSKSG